MKENIEHRTSNIEHPMDGRFALIIAQSALRADYLFSLQPSAFSLFL
jgi:hypothetical protein